MERYMILLKSIKRMNSELEHALRENVYPITLAPKQVLAPDDMLYFIEKGLLHYYILKNKDQISLEFRWEDQFVNTLQVMMDKNPYPDATIEALEETVLWCFPGNLVQELLKKYDRFTSHYMEILLRDHLITMHFSRYSKPGEGLSNFNRLIAKFPQLVHRVPAQYLANLMDLAEEALRHLTNSEIKLLTDPTRRRRIRPDSAI